MTDSIACFTDFYKIKIFPLLHQTKIKVKVSGDRDSDNHIIATKFYEPNFLVTADQSGYLKVWNMKTGKYLVQEKEFKSKLFEPTDYICKDLLVLLDFINRALKNQ